ncbi:urea ABC transporter permease subunit UrtB [Phytohalomonas tamaricis]|uniref:urea ABC transporter permease subunit UrtB n=1 Tax=Phytohalomonas tamaricis TaxID=2081032 RepID=UPI000D0AC85B|nr:urea ABC transporter permease subunit UrtB [Phytohalomonas tamaricis]
MISRQLIHTFFSVLLLLGMALSLAAHAEDSADASQAKQLLEALDVRSYDAKGEAIKQLAQSDLPQKGEWLEALRDGRLQRQKDGGRFVIVESDQGREWPIKDAISGEELGTATRRDLDKVRINNQLRSQLQGLAATADLDSPDTGRREAAAKRLIGEVDETTADSVAVRLEQETDGDVKARLRTALGLYRLEQGEADAIDTLRGSLDPAVRNALRPIAAGDGPLADEARTALNGIEQKLKFNRWLQTLYFGISMGSVLVLAAIGLAITFGVMGVINMAHGELIMLGAYTTFVIQQLLPGQPGLALGLSIPAGFLVAAAFGIAIERGVIRFLKGRPLETLLATFGISLILQQLVRSVFSPLNRSVVTPDWLQGSLVINDALALTLNRLAVIVFCLIVFTALMIIMRRTRLGLEVRAVTQNRTMARAMGVKAARVDILTFGLGSGIAGLAGVALSQLTNVGPNMGQSYIIDSFMVVVFGGVGNLWGTLVAGMSLGIVNQVIEPWAGAVLAKILVLAFIILFIQKRPRGLFPQKGRAAE